MKLNKDKGIKLLQSLGMPTTQRIDINQIVTGQIKITKGLSVRLSPLSENLQTNVNLPSIHNCTDIQEIKDFINKYRGQYRFIIHETVKPELIGSVSKLDFNNSVVLETFNNFTDREQGVVSNRMIIPFHGDRMMISKLEMLKKDENDYRNFTKVIYYLSEIPFSNYDMEYVIQDGEILFTDLTAPDNSINIYLEELNKSSKGRDT